MAWVPKIEGRTVFAIDSKNGARRAFDCGPWKGPVSASIASAEEFVIQVATGKTFVWNIKNGGYKEIG